MRESKAMKDAMRRRAGQSPAARRGWAIIERGRVAMCRRRGCAARAGMGAKRRGEGVGGAPADSVAAQAEPRIRKVSALCRHAGRASDRAAARRENRRSFRRARRVSVHRHRRSDPDRGRSRRRYARSRGIERRHAYHRQLGRQVRGGRLGLGRPDERRRLQSATVRSEAARSGAGGAGCPVRRRSHKATPATPASPAAGATPQNSASGRAAVPAPAGAHPVGGVSNLQTGE